MTTKLHPLNFTTPGYWCVRCFLLFVVTALLNVRSHGQCIQANAHTSSGIPLLSSVTNPASAYDLSDGNTTTAATLTVNGIGLATLRVSFDNVANQGDSIVVLFGVPTANIFDWGSLGGTTFTPFSGTNATGTASNSVTAANLSFLITVGANSLARIAIPVTSALGARSLQISYLGIGAALNKRTFIYDVAVKPGPVVTSAEQFVCAPGGTATFTGQYNALAAKPIDVIWYASDGTTVLQTDANHTGSPYTSSFTTPFVNSTTTFYVRERWAGCTVLSDPKPVTLTVRQPLTPDISITCGSPVTLATTLTGAQGAVNYVWSASNGGVITSGANSATPTITTTGSYQVTITDANGCVGTVTENFTTSDCAALPVTLVNFLAKKKESVVALSWITTSEVNSDKFEIERSTSNKTWSAIGVVAAKENDGIKHYSFIDIAPFGGTNMYRLKMIDRDGTYAYSRIQSLDLGNTSEIVVFPNPVGPDDQLQLLLDSRNVQNVTVYDMSGKRLYQSDQVTNGINVKDLQVGKYVIRIKLKDGSESSQIFVKK